MARNQRPNQRVEHRRGIKPTPPKTGSARTADVKKKLRTQMRAEARVVRKAMKRHNSSMRRLVELRNGDKAKAEPSATSVTFFDANKLERLAEHGRRLVLLLSKKRDSAAQPLAIIDRFEAIERIHNSNRWPFRDRRRGHLCFADFDEHAALEEFFALIDSLLTAFGCEEISSTIIDERSHSNFPDGTASDFCDAISKARWPSQATVAKLKDAAAVVEDIAREKRRRQVAKQLRTIDAIAGHMPLIRETPQIGEQNPAQPPKPKTRSGRHSDPRITAIASWARGVLNRDPELDSTTSKYRTLYVQLKKHPTLKQRVPDEWKDPSVGIRRLKGAIRRLKERPRR